MAGPSPAAGRPETRASGVPALPRAEARGMAFRPMADDDLPFLAGLYAAGRADEVAPLPWTDAEKAAFLDMQFRAQHAHYIEHYPDARWLIVEHEGARVGRLYLERWPSEMRVIDIALMPGARGRGWGRAMMEDVMALAAAGGLGVGIHVEKNNPALRLYERLGFTRRKDKGVYWLMRWDAPAPVR